MTWIHTIIAAFSMFSAIPMPRITWNERVHRYILLAFPLIGIAIGALVALWCWICSICAIPQLVFACGLVIVPIVVTGGIHLDGFCDVSDAWGSHASRKHKLEIMSDPHIGSFAVIHLGIYLLIYVACASLITPSFTTAICLAGVYVMTRAASGFASTVFPRAKHTGMMHSYANAQEARTVAVGDAAICIAVGIVLGVLFGAVGWCMLLVTILITALYRFGSIRILGGVTGDTAGWFLQVVELLGVVILAAVRCA